MFCYLLEQLEALLSNNAFLIDPVLRTMTDLTEENNSLKAQIELLSKEGDAEDEEIAELTKHIEEIQDNTAEITSSKMESEDMTMLTQNVATMNMNSLNKEKLLEDILLHICANSKIGFFIVDIYFAFDTATSSACVLVIYTGPQQIDKSIINGVVVKFKRRLCPDYYVKAWCAYRKHMQISCATFCEAFASSPSCVGLISDHSDVVVIFPAVRKSASTEDFEEIIQVVVKAIGYIPLGESPIPTQVDLGKRNVHVISVEGYSEECVASGDAIGNCLGQLGFGSIAGEVSE